MSDGPMGDIGYIIAQQVTDDVFGKGTYAEINKGNPDPKVQRAIRATQNTEESDGK